MPDSLTVPPAEWAHYNGNLTLPSPRSGRPVDWLTRTDTNDGALVAGIIASDEYHLGELPPLHGTAIDIGAHIGIVTLALARDHEDLKVIAVEVVPDNVLGLRINIEHNGMGDRVSVVLAAADAPGKKTTTVHWNYTWAENSDQAYTDDSRYIANLFGASSTSEAHVVKSVSLDMLMLGIDRLALLKIDCEGCEWAFLRSKRTADVDIIIGEYHNGGGVEGIRSRIGATHDVEKMGGGDDVGMFRAIRR